MKSFLRIAFVCAAGAALLSSTSPSLLAQGRGGGGRGGMMGGGITRAQLTTTKEVQAELKLTDDQKKAATDAIEKMNTARQELFASGAGGGGDRAAMMEKMTKLTSETDAAIVGKLDDAQKKRLTEIYVQKAGTNALADAEVQKALGLDEAAVKKVTEAITANREASMTAMRELGQDATPEERQEKMATLRKTGDEKLFSAITPEQKAAFEKLGGTPLEIDMSQLRGGPGRGNRGGRQNN